MGEGSFELTKSVMSGSEDGKRLWVCHYNRPDENKKPLRSVSPTYVEVVSNDKLPDGKRVYYSKSHYVTIGKSGELTKKIISPVDNTGYRSFVGNMLFTFESEGDCVSAWQAMVMEFICRLEKKKLVVVSQIQSEIDELKSKI